MWNGITPNDYVVATMPIHHPETLQEIVHDGDWLSLKDLESLNKEYGVDEVIGHIVRWPT